MKYKNIIRTIIYPRIKYYHMVNKFGISFIIVNNILIYYDSNNLKNKIFSIIRYLMDK
jgi:hypothetical protein